MIILPLLLLGGVFSLLLFSAATIFLDDTDPFTLSEFGAHEIPSEYIPYYQEAGEKFNINWIVLAAVHRVETVFSTMEPMVSPVGAVGHMQFMPCTWVGWNEPTCGGLGKGNILPSKMTSLTAIDRYGGYGIDGSGNGKADPYDIEDAIHSAANYLSTFYRGNTEEDKIRNALIRYNHSQEYVDMVYGIFLSYTMGYDENVIAEVKGGTAFPAPHTLRITSHFNPARTHPVTGEIRPHNGIDIAGAGNDRGMPIVAFADGTVRYSQYNGGFGHLVIIDHGDGIETYYAHLNQQGIPAGSRVRAGQTIGYMGDSGTATGVHLHFEYRINGQPVNPMPYLQKFF